MGFTISMFLCNLLIPVIMLIGGYFMYKHPPKNINSACGYRTRRSMKSEETWRFANTLCGKLWLKMSVPVIIISVTAQLPFIGADKDTFGNLTLVIEIIQIVLLIIPAFIVEKKLKADFDDEGRRN